MRKRFRKLIAVILTTIIIFSSLMFSSVSVEATQDRTYNFYTNYNLTGNPVDDIVSVAMAQQNRTKASMGYTEAWCADFVGDCADLAGLSYAIPRAGYCGTLWDNIINSGGYQVTSPQKGDIVFYYCTASYCPNSGAPWVHVGIMTSSSSSIEGNSGGKVTAKSTITYTDTNGHTYGHAGTNSVIVKYLRPKYKDEPDYVNVGDDFYAYIINTDSWLLATNDNGNVNASKENYNSNQVWHFTRLSNGSYKIVSQKDSSCMEVHNFETQNGTNVEMHPYNDNSAQHWYIYGKSAQYIFRAECGDNVLDLSGGAEGAGNGTNLQMWENNGTNAQKFQIWKLDFPSLGIPNVEVSNYGGTNGDNIKLTWNSCENATGYDIRIYDESGNNNLYMYYNVQGTSFTTRIPSGKYIAEVTALNSMFNTWQFGARTFFSCANNFGTDFYAYIINTDSWLHATNSGKGDVTANTLTGNSNQIWHFERLENGSYKVISCMDNQCMEVHNFESSNGTNVEMHHYDNNSAQHWYIYGESSQYIFRAECGDNVLDLSGGAEGAGNGTNLQMWENNETNAQKFQLWILDKPNLQAPDVIVQNYLDENDNNIKLSWNGCNDATGYDIRILDENGTDILYMFYNVQGTSFTTKLPQGNYIAEVTALNNRFNIWKYGSRMHFQVKNQIGDTNLDGHITISDVTAIQRHLAELARFTDEQLALADTNGDGKVDVADATHLQKYLAGYKGIVLGKS